MIAHQIGQPARQAQRVVKNQFDPTPGQAIPVVLFQRQRAIGIEHRVHRDPAPRGAGQGIDETIGDAAGLEQVHAKTNLLARLADGGQHRRKKTVAIDQQPETVALAPAIMKTLPVCQGRNHDGLRRGRTAVPAGAMRKHW